MIPDHAGLTFPDLTRLSLTDVSEAYLHTGCENCFYPPVKLCTLTVADTLSAPPDSPWQESVALFLGACSGYQSLEVYRVNVLQEQPSAKEPQRCRVVIPPSVALDSCSYRSPPKSPTCTQILFSGSASRGPSTRHRREQAI